MKTLRKILQMKNFRKLLGHSRKIHLKMGFLRIVIRSKRMKAVNFDTHNKLYYDLLKTTFAGFVLFREFEFLF